VIYLDRFERSTVTSSKSDRNKQKVTSMNNSLITLLGLSAAIIGTITYFPQLLKVLKTKQTKDISLPTYLLLDTVTAMWLVYGVLTKDIPLTLNGTLVLTCVLIITFLKIKYG